MSTHYVKLKHYGHQCFIERNKGVAIFKDPARLFKMVHDHFYDETSEVLSLIIKQYITMAMSTYIAYIEPQAIVIEKVESIADRVEVSFSFYEWPVALSWNFKSFTVNLEKIKLN